MRLGNKSWRVLGKRGGGEDKEKVVGRNVLVAGGFVFGAVSFFFCGFFTRVVERKYVFGVVVVDCWVGWNGGVFKLGAESERVVGEILDDGRAVGSRVCDGSGGT